MGAFGSKHAAGAGGADMTITTEEAEWLAKQHDLVRFTLGMKAPEHDLTAATIRCLAAEPDALQARVTELEEGLKDAAASVGEWGAYASQYLQEKWDLPGEVARYVAIAEGKKGAALEGKKDE